MSEDATPVKTQVRDEDLDITEKPNFTAFREWLDKNYGTGGSLPKITGWLDKLERWAELSVEAGENDRQKIEELEGEKESLDVALGEAQADADALEGLRTMIADVGRGIATWDDVTERAREPWEPVR